MIQWGTINPDPVQKTPLPPPTQEFKVKSANVIGQNSTGKCEGA